MTPVVAGIFETPPFTAEEEVLAQKIIPLKLCSLREPGLTRTEPRFPAPKSSGVLFGFQ